MKVCIVFVKKVTVWKFFCENIVFIKVKVQKVHF